jgi:3-deoxy-8-phosphooctulonate synthase
MFFLLAGPCVIEGEDMALRIAERVVKITDKLHIPYVFKGSYRKANRSRLDSFTGIGDEKALKILAKVRSTFNVPVVTDIHTASEAEMAAEYVDVLQIPAFLCRQTDLLVAAARTGKIVNIKKGQFLSPAAMRFAADKVVEAGNDQVMLTERIIELGDKKELVTQEDLPYIVSDVLKHGVVSESVKLKSYIVTLAHGLKPMATVKIEINGKEFEENSSGDGQYDAFVRALRKIYKVTLGRKFPMLTNYAVSIPPGGRTDAFVQTVITWSFEEKVFRTRGLDADQTEAAIKATMKMLNIIENEYENNNG